MSIDDEITGLDMADGLGWAEFDEFPWFVGLFEGEGCIHPTRKTRPNGRVYLQLQVCSTDEDVVRRAHRVAAAGTVNGPHYRKNKPHCKPQWIWQCSGDTALRLVLQMWPHLGRRRSTRAFEAIKAAGYMETA